MKLKGVKNDDGVPFTLLTNDKLKHNLRLWMQTTSFPLDAITDEKLGGNYDHE